MQNWTKAAILAVALISGALLYILVGWRRSPRAYRAIVRHSRLAFVAGALAGVWASVGLPITMQFGWNEHQRSWSTSSVERVRPRISHRKLKRFNFVGAPSPVGKYLLSKSDNKT